MVADVDNDDDDVTAAGFLPRLSRPCSAPRMSAAVANRPCKLSSEAALVSELAQRGRHASQLDATDSVDVFEMLSRFHSATFPGLGHVVADAIDDRRQTNPLHASDVAATAPLRLTNYRPSCDNDEEEVYDDLLAADSTTDYGGGGAPSDGIVRWTVAESVPDAIGQNPDDGDEFLEDEDNGLFSDDGDDDDVDDGISVSSMSSAVEYAPSDEVQPLVDGGNLRLADTPAGRQLTSTPMTSDVIPACLRDEKVFPHQSQTTHRQTTSSSSPCDDDADLGGDRVRESSAPDTAAAAVSKYDDAAAVTQNDAPTDCTAARRRVVMYYPPQAYKFYIEQHMENVMKAYEERRRHRAQLEAEMDQLRLPDDARTQMRRMLFQKESYHNRLRRTRMERSAFRPISVLGRGAFADVLLVRKRDSGALYAMKRLRKSDVLRNRQAAHVKAERDILAEADNEWIVRLFYSFQVRSTDATYWFCASAVN